MRSYTALTAAAALLLLLLVSLAAAADMSIVSYGERSEEETRRMFVEWMATHGKTYYSIIEEERRYALFKDNLRLIDKHNAAADAGVYTYTASASTTSPTSPGRSTAPYVAVPVHRHGTKIKSGGSTIPGEMKHWWI